MIEVIVPGGGIYARGFRRLGAIILLAHLIAVGLLVAFALAGSPTGYWVAILALIAARVAGIVSCARRRTQAAKPGRVELGVVLVLVLIGLELGRELVVTRVTTVVRVPADSMYPSISAGDHVVVDKTARALRRGAIVALRVDDSGAVFVKRLVGLPGDTVRMQSNDFFLNGTKLAHRSLGTRCRDMQGCDLVEESNGGARYAIALSTKVAIDLTPVVTIPADHVYVLNDNRSFGADSRVFGYWPWEVADARRLDEFLAAYENGDLSDDERFTLMEIILQSFEDLAASTGFDARWDRALDTIDRNVDRSASLRPVAIARTTRLRARAGRSC